MSLVKRLQRDLTCIELPWLPPSDRLAAQLINQIVLGEETDVGPAGEPISHLELYLAAMREVGASTAKFEAFRSALVGGEDLSTAFERAAVPPFVRQFTGLTLRTAREAPLCAVMASFFYGREDAIPHMFDNLLKSWGLDGARAPMFVYYLKRHIELDADQHGPAAERILATAIDGNTQRQRQVAAAARESIQPRISLWDGLLASICGRPVADVLSGNRAASAAAKPKPRLVYSSVIEAGGQPRLSTDRQTRTRQPGGHRSRKLTRAKTKPRSMATARFSA
jgi:hypothetical protein